MHVVHSAGFLNEWRNTMYGSLSGLFRLLQRSERNLENLETSHLHHLCLFTTCLTSQRIHIKLHLKLCYTWNRFFLNSSRHLTLISVQPSLIWFKLIWGETELHSKKWQNTFWKIQGSSSSSSSSKNWDEPPIANECDVLFCRYAAPGNYLHPFKTVSSFSCTCAVCRQ